MRNISFCDGAQTSLHLHLDHLQFLDWDVLHRAAMLAPRAAMTFFMIMNRMRARQIPTEAERERERENESLGNSKLIRY